MMNYKQLKMSLLALLLLFAAAPPSPAAEKSFHILMINDPHSYILPYYEADKAGLPAGAVKVGPVGGLSRALRLTANERKNIETASQSPIFLFEGGDIMLGKKGSLQNGHAEYGSLAALGFDAGVLGNHDFDGGVSVLAKLGPELKFPVLASNITFKDAVIDSFYPKTKIIKKGDVSVGVFGLVTPGLKALISDPDGFDIERDIVKKAGECVRDLRAQGVDAVVALNHIGLDLDKKLAAAVPGIDVIVGGHSHDAVKEPLFIKNPQGSRTLIGQAGLNGSYAGRFDVTVDDGALVAEKSSWKLMTVQPGTTAEKESEALGLAAREILAATLDIADPAVFFARSIDARKEAMRTRENELGNLAAEALRWNGGARIGVINGGALRIGRIVPPGPFTAVDMLDLMPFDDVPVRLLVSGAEIRMQLEAAASALKGRNDDYDPTRRMSTGEFLQVAGLRFDIDLGEPAAVVDNRRLVSPGSRVKNIAVDSSRGWVPLEDDKIYSVAALDYTVKHWNVLSSVPAGRTAIACFDRYLAEVLRRRADPKTDGRINIIN
ncbi:bifunctional UDP-sugar hydrolase/5'-nucleotidase [Cloacibacillus evryensis]|uniref:bifunctional metallophosphatase/5'-nucleotidase n=2 Tax=Cloacibacillus evryensis TaxID=508460 RepID=UPI000300311D|nr:bifunctional UDP-sugar hydrolase/5'-nucleotidase [Cloacibacillus evryensis]